MYVLIYEFNEMLCKLARFSWFPNVFHIDCRNVARSSDDWFDEIHLKSSRFKEIAEAYRHCIARHKGDFRTYAQTNTLPQLSPNDKVVSVSA